MGIVCARESPVYVRYCAFAWWHGRLHSITCVMCRWVCVQACARLRAPRACTMRRAWVLPREWVCVQRRVCVARGAAAAAVATGAMMAMAAVT